MEEAVLFEELTALNSVEERIEKIGADLQSGLKRYAKIVSPPLLDLIKDGGSCRQVQCFSGSSEDIWEHEYECPSESEQELEFLVKVFVAVFEKCMTPSDFKKFHRELKNTDYVGDESIEPRLRHEWLLDFFKGQSADESSFVEAYCEQTCWWKENVECGGRITNEYEYWFRTVAGYEFKIVTDHLGFIVGSSYSE